MAHTNYRSQLEQSWAVHFARQGATWEYVDKHFADFRVNGELVEIKPDSTDPRFLHQAVDRMIRCQTSGLIYCGDPDDHDIWRVNSNSLRITLVQTSKRIAGKRITRPIVMTLQQFKSLMEKFGGTQAPDYSSK